MKCRGGGGVISQRQCSPGSQFHLAAKQLNRVRFLAEHDVHKVAMEDIHPAFQVEAAIPIQLHQAGP